MTRPTPQQLIERARARLAFPLSRQTEREHRHAALDLAEAVADMSERLQEVGFDWSRSEPAKTLDRYLATLESDRA